MAVITINHEVMGQVYCSHQVAMSENNQSLQKLYYIFNGRFPSEKAHALFVAKSAQAFSDIGYDVTIITARRRGRAVQSAELFYSLAEPLQVVYLPIIDIYSWPVPRKLPYFISNLSFSLSLCMYANAKLTHNAILYSNELISLFFVSWFFKQTVYEMHDYPGSKRWLFGKMIRRFGHVVTQNKWKKEKLVADFLLAAETIHVENNAVDVAAFDTAHTKTQAREQLHLPIEQRMVVYTGHLFGWKGVETLAAAAQLSPEKEFYFVGGTDKDVAAFQALHSAQANIHIIGYRPHEEMPIWQKAADCLVVPNTATEDISRYYTSPMKLFEYMVSKRPIVVSDLPSIRAVVDETVVHFVAPDDPDALQLGIEKVLQDSAYSDRITAAAFSQVHDYTWQKRATRIKSFIDS